MFKIPFIEKNIILILFIFSLTGLIFPNCFIWARNLPHLLLSLIAFCVGLNLKPENFIQIMENKKFIFPVLIFKTLLAPPLTFVICKLLNVPTIYTIGLVTLTCCPAANTGNIMCYLSKGNTALIVITTITGALMAPLITPGVIFVLLHKIVQIKFSEIVLLIATGITLPMIFGIMINVIFSQFIESIGFIIPTIGILSVSLIVATVLSQHAQQILSLGVKLPLVSSILIITFLSMGFIFSRLIKCGVDNAIAMSFEIGTFDGVLGILLVMQIASNSAVIAVILFAVLNLLIGAVASKIFNSNKFIAVYT